MCESNITILNITGYIIVTESSLKSCEKIFLTISRHDRPTRCRDNRDIVEYLCARAITSLRLYISTLVVT